MSEFRERTGLDHFHQRILERASNNGAAPVLIVAFGDSVTQGGTALGEQIPNEVYHARFKRLLEARYPNSIFSVINAGYGGWTATGAIDNLQRDVLRHGPDLVLVAFGLNDSGQGIPGTVGFADSLRQIVSRVKQETTANVIMLTPSFMNTADNPRVAFEHREANLPQLFAEIQNGGTLAAYAEAIRQVAQEQQVLVADVYAEWSNMAAGGVNTDEMLANGLNHPTAEAHAIPAQLLMQLVIDTEAGEASS